MENYRSLQGHILQNKNGQYFFVCSKCNLEFVTLQSFIIHQGHMQNESPLVLNDCVAESKATIPRLIPKKEVEVSADSTDKIKFPNTKRTILVPPTRKVQRKRSGQMKTSAPLKLRPNPFVRVQAQQQVLDLRVEVSPDNRKYKCKNCDAAFITMVYLESHETICQMASFHSASNDGQYSKCSTMMDL